MSEPRVKNTSQSLLLILLAFCAAVFLVWIVRTSWVLEGLAGFILLANFLVAAYCGRLIYKRLDAEYPHWASLTVSIILGIAIGLAIAEVTHSHQLIRDYEHWSSDADE
jgi:uncharacterized membrane protein AbrB (regulator of aidB expression)